MKDVFISYRTLETDFALKLAASLTAAGYAVWMDRLKGIQPGDDWVLTLQNALNDMSVLVPVLSPEYIKSDHCHRELLRAKNLKKPIIPVMLKLLERKDFPFEIEDLQYVDFTAWQDEAVYQKQVKKLVQEGLQDTAKVMPSAPLAAPAPASVGNPLPGRVIEDQVAASQQAVKAASGKSIVVELRLKKLGAELDMYTRQYSAVVERLVITPDPMTETQFKGQLAFLEQKISDTDAEIKKLTSE